MIKSASTMPPLLHHPYVTTNKTSCLIGKCCNSKANSRWSKLGLAAVLVSALAACANQPEPDVTPVFHTHISEDNAKLFKFYLLMHRDNESHGQGKKSSGQQAKSAKPNKGGRDKKQGGQKGSGKGGGRNDPQTGEVTAEQSLANESNEDIATQMKNRKQLMLSDLLLQQLTEHVAQQGYCRQGFRTFDEKIGKGVLSIKGECYDSATAKDKQAFVSRDITE